MSGDSHGSPSKLCSSEYEEQMLIQLFQQCDSEIRTGQVRSVDLINAIQRLVNVSADRGLIDKLSSLMDPKNDNAYLTISEFVDVGKQWMDHVKQSHNQDIENRSEIFNVPTLKKPLKKIGPLRTVHFKRLNSNHPDSNKCSPVKPLSRRTDYLTQSSGCSSLGLLDLRDLEDTFGDEEDSENENEDSYDNITGNGNERQGAQNETNSDRLDFLSRELDELRKRNNKLSEEKTNLHSQFLATEDTICLLQKENSALKTQLKTVEHCNESKSGLETKIRYHSEVMNQAEEKCILLKENLNNYRDMSENLSIENSRLREELDKCHESLNIARLNCNDSCIAMDELTKELESLKLGMADQAITLCEMTKEKEVLAFKLNETQQIKERLEFEIEQCKSELAMGSESPKNWNLTDSSVNPDHLFNVGEISFDRPDFDQVFGSDSKQRLERDKGPSAFSTPFNQKFIRPVRGSIGDEIKELGLEGLPLCDKHIKKESQEIATQTDTVYQAEVLVNVGIDKCSKCEGKCDAVENDEDFDEFKTVPDKTTFFNVTTNMVTSPKVLFMSGITLLALLAFFTFLGGVEYGHQTLYPITWGPEYGFPDPVFLASFKIRRQPNFW